MSVLHGYCYLLQLKDTMVVSGMHSEIRRLCPNKRFPTAKWFTILEYMSTLQQYPLHCWVLFGQRANTTLNNWPPYAFVPSVHLGTLTPWSLCHWSVYYPLITIGIYMCCNRVLPPTTSQFRQGKFRLTSRGVLNAFTERAYKMSKANKGLRPI